MRAVTTSGGTAAGANAVTTVAWWWDCTHKTHARLKVTTNSGAAAGANAAMTGMMVGLHAQAPSAMTRWWVDPQTPAASSGTAQGDYEQ